MQEIRQDAEKIWRKKIPTLIDQSINRSTKEWLQYEYQNRINQASKQRQCVSIQLATIKDFLTIFCEYTHDCDPHYARDP